MPNETAYESRTLSFCTLASTGDNLIRVAPQRRVRPAAARTASRVPLNRTGAKDRGQRKVRASRMRGSGHRPADGGTACHRCDGTASCLAHRTRKSSLRVDNWPMRSNRARSYGLRPASARRIATVSTAAFSQSTHKAVELGSIDTNSRRSAIRPCLGVGQIEVKPLLLLQRCDDFISLRRHRGRNRKPDLV
jgi:hypothetical protein